MSIIPRIRRIFSGKPTTPEREILPVEEQASAWRGADKKMKWGIPEEELERIGVPPPLIGSDLEHGFVGVIVCYGFGDDGAGHADSVLSGKLAWEYARRQRGRSLWQSPYIDFDQLDHFRLRPGAPGRPRGFYFAKIQLGERFMGMTVSEARRRFDSLTGCGPEGLQFLCVTHTHFPDLMSDRKRPFMALADYDVAPHGFGDFFDAPQLFSSNRVLGLGIGNVDQSYRGFGIPTVRF
ncbi:MAG: hypothetical protein P8Y85_01325 [Nitrospirota bacterium]|jgi:hypothetical protein